LNLLGRDSQDEGAGARENSDLGRQSRELDNRHFSVLKRASTSQEHTSRKQHKIEEDHFLQQPI